MVLINDTKYACEACIKGHRSSTCKHTDRPLFEIKKKGRPVTQCEHCRALRKTKQVHVKCLCEVKPDDGIPKPKPKKGSLKKVLASAAFPDGLPEGLGASVAPQASSEASSDSDPGDSQAPCNCKHAGDCHCCHVKRPIHKQSTSVNNNNKPTPSAHPPPLTRIGDLRPVLPKPANHPSPETSHAPFQHNRRPQHGSTFFNPYGRAYQEHAAPQPPLEEEKSKPSFSQAAFFSELNHLPQKPGERLIPELFAGTNLSWSSTSNQTSPAELSVFCGCGDTCACPGCVQHKGADAWTNGVCNDPGICNACLTCSIPNAPVSAPTPPTTPLAGQFASSQFADLEEWIRNMPNLPQPATSYFPPPDPQQSFVPFPGFQPGNDSDMTIPDTFDFGMNAETRPSECCGARCKCARGQCSCPADCCGCCHGCQCEGHDHESKVLDGVYNFDFCGSGNGLRYAVSGERSACCSGSPRRIQGHNQSRSESDIDSLVGGEMFGIDDGISQPGPSNVSVSRTSSTSSRSSLSFPMDTAFSTDGPSSSQNGPYSLRSLLSNVKASSTTDLLPADIGFASSLGRSSRSTTDVSTFSQAFDAEAFDADMPFIPPYAVPVPSSDPRASFSGTYATSDGSPNISEDERGDEMAVLFRTMF